MTGDEQPVVDQSPDAVAARQATRRAAAEVAVDTFTVDLAAALAQSLVAALHRLGRTGPWQLDDDATVTALQPEPTPEVAP